MGRAPCCDKDGLKKGPWTPEEDLKLINYIQVHGAGNWRILPKKAGLQRCGKSCRLRWTNYLRPDIKRGKFSFEEEETIIQLHSVLGNKWSAIAARLPGRTDNEIKNYWNTHIRKRLLRNGIDPVTHSPRLDLLDISSILTSAFCNPSLLNVSNFLGAHALLNPEMLRLATTLFSLKQENPETLLQFLQQKQLCSSQLQSAVQMLQSGNHQLQSLVQDVSTCTTSAAPCTSFSNQAQLMQPNVEWWSSNMPNFGCQDSLESLMPLSLNEDFASQPNYVSCTSNSNPSVPILSENAGLQSQSLNVRDDQKFGFDSVLSSPSPLNSSSTFVNSSTEDERESYCSSLLKFEIPESLDINDFL